MALPLPYTIDDQSWPEARDAIQENFDAIVNAVSGFGGKAVEFRLGTGTVTFAAGNQTSGITTVTHGLGRQPVVVLLTAIAEPGAGWTFHGRGYTTTTFGAWARTDVAPAAGNLGFAWVAIG